MSQYPRQKPVYKKTVKKLPFIFHLTCIENIEPILRDGMKPRNQLKPELSNFFMSPIKKDIADPDIIERRKVYDLGNYVPFHFFYGSRFDYVASKDFQNTEQVLICITRKLAMEKNFKIIPVHPLSTYNKWGEPLDFQRGYNELDWDAIEKKAYWYEHDYERNVALAECLYEGVIPPDWIHTIYCNKKSTMRAIQQLVDDNNLNIKVVSEKRVFYHW